MPPQIVDVHVVHVKIMGAQLAIEMIEEDVDYAFSFLEKKLKFLNELSAQKNQNISVDHRLVTPQMRRDILSKSLGGETVSNQLAKDTLAKYGIETNEKMVYRTLKGFAIHRGKDKWKIPK